MKSQKELPFAELLRRKGALLGRRIEFFTGELCSGSREAWDVWRGELGEICLMEYSCGILVTFLMREAFRLVSVSTNRSYLEEKCQECVFEISPFEFSVHLWNNGDISIQAGKHGLDQVFMIYAPAVPMLLP